MYPVSTLNAGLFSVAATEVKLADLIDGQGRKLKDVVPATALTVSLRNVSIDDLVISGQARSRLLVAQETVELPVADLDKFTTSYEGAEGCCSLVVSYTVPMGKAG